MRFVQLTFVAAVTGFAGAAHADTFGDTTLGGGLSILGATIEGTYQIEPDARIRGMFIGGISYSDSELDDDGNTYAIDAEISAAALLVDFYPHGSGWRISGGVLFNVSDIEALGTGGPSEPFELNGTTYDGGSVAAEVSFVNQVAPMVTTGYDYPLNENWVLSGEIGAIYTGGLNIDVTANRNALQAEIDNDADYEDIRSDARDLTLLPYISVSVGFRF